MMDLISGFVNIWIMAFNLQLADCDKEFVKIVGRQFKKRDLDLFNLSKKNLRELDEILSEIKKDTLPKKYVLRKLKGNIGQGIFLHVDAKPIQKGQVIAPYTGKVSLEAQVDANDGDYTFDLVTDIHLTKLEQEKFDSKNRFAPRRLYDLKLDAKKIGNFTRYINHSNKPNVEAVLVHFKDHGFQIVYMAKSKINPGEQLLVSYEGEEDSYWGPLGITPFPMTAKTFHLDDSCKLVFTQS